MVYLIVWFIDLTIWPRNVLVDSNVGSTVGGALAFPDLPLATPLQNHLFYSIMLEKCQKTNFKREDVFRILIRKAADFAYCLQLLLYCCNINEIRERQDILVPTFSGLWLILYCYPAGSPCLSLMCSTMVIRAVEFSSKGYKIRKSFAWVRQLLNFENWCNGEVSKSAKIWLSKSIFLVKKLEAHYL